MLVAASPAGPGGSFVLRYVCDGSSDSGTTQLGRRAQAVHQGGASATTGRPHRILSAVSVPGLKLPGRALKICTSSDGMPKFQLCHHILYSNCPHITDPNRRPTNVAVLQLRPFCCCRCPTFILAGLQSAVKHGTTCKLCT